MAVVTLDRLSKRYERAHKPAVDEVSLTVADAEFMVLLGPSGCGKTTTLRMVAGLESISSGLLAIDGRTVNAVPAKDRDIAMVFQSYALYPHMSVRQNLAFGLRRRGVDRAEVGRRVTDVAATLGLSELLDRRPHALSGGQRQRVALGRAIVRDPKVFLFDEPLSNLDAALRASTRLEIAKLHRRLKATMIYVTHDQVEAMTLGDRICVMNDGRVAQIGAPLDVYRRPASVFVARFLGSPPMNIVPARLDGGADRLSALVGGNGFRLDGAAAPAELPAEGAVLLGFRPEDVALVPPGSGPRATVQAVESLGAETILSAALDGGGEIAVRAPRDLAATAGERIGLAVPPHALHLFDPQTGAALPRRAS
ncbi:MAG TPA: sn-glycerol-3-phosphate ABC transporter ATP-binding protein UgpC [Beijerinckiaceae bacterium]|jgi:multiple sugar transport system ATP-binding protein